MRGERGEFNLVGVLVAASLMIVVLGATLTTFSQFYQGQSDSQKRAEADDRARVAVDQMAREMRNLATPTNLDPIAVDLATDYDMVFETVASQLPAGATQPLTANPTNVERVRYCLTPAAADGTRMLVRMEQPAVLLAGGYGVPSTSSCSISGAPQACNQVTSTSTNGWYCQRAVATALTNTYGGKSRPAFSFNSTTLNQVTRVSIDLFVDTDPSHGPAEQQISSGVYLRNQDRPPTAAFTWSSLTKGSVSLNASASSDPDNDPLSYCWYDAGFTGSVGTCGTGSIGSTPVLSYTTSSGSHTITLKVTDPSGLSATSSKTVTVS